MREITNPCKNEVNFVGKLLSMEIREGNSKEKGLPYVSARYVTRVEQTYDGVTDRNDIQHEAIAMKFDSEGKITPAYQGIMRAKDMKTVADYGNDEASWIKVGNGRYAGKLTENIYARRDGSGVASSTRIETRFTSTVSNPPEDGPYATFVVEGYIFDKAEEMDAEGEPTSRLVLTVGVVQYGERLDVFKMFVEAPQKVDWVSRNWDVGMTVLIRGRIRSCVREVATSTGGWGDAIPGETAPRTVRELIITGGNDEALDEEMCYDEDEIRKLYNARKMRMEQIMLNAKKPAPAQTATAPTQKKRPVWEM